MTSWEKTHSQTQQPSGNVWSQPYQFSSKLPSTISCQVGGPHLLKCHFKCHYYLEGQLEHKVQQLYVKNNL